MKTLNFLIIVLSGAMFITACKDDGPAGTPQQVTKTYTYSQNLRGSAGVKGELPLTVFKLADIIGNDPAQHFKNAEMQLASSNLEIAGLSQLESSEGTAVVLQDFSIKVGSRQAVNLGDCSTDPQGTDEFASDVQQSTNEIIGIIQNIFTDLTSGNKTATITVSFTPSVDITTSDNIQLKISVGGTYHYEEFE